MEKKVKYICMIVYTDYLADPRVRREAETLAELPEFNVRVLALKNSAETRSCDVDGVKLIEINEEKYCGKSRVRYILSYFRFMFLSMLTCTKLFLAGKLDVVHVHNMPNFLVFAAVIPRIFRKKVILDLHDTVPETYAAKFNTTNSLLFSIFYIEEIIACAFSHKIICVNHVQRDAVVRRGIPKRKIIVSMNVPDPNRFNLNKLKGGDKVSSGKFKLIYHGTVVKRLGIDLIIRAVDILKEKIPNIEFNIWGKSGDDRDEFIKLSEELGLQNKVRFRERVPIEKLGAKLVNMDLGVVGNRKSIATELMLPVKMLEYIALKIPVVVPRLKGIEYYFSDDMVSYFEPGDVDSMANAILKLYKDASLREVQAEKAMSFLDIYGWGKHKMDLINLYRKL